MARTCTICTHPQKAEIDSALLAGNPFRNIAERFGTSTSALFRHKKNDIPLALAKAQEAREIDYGNDVFAQVKGLNARTLRILKQAESAGDSRTALSAIREARGNSELLCRMIVAAEARQREEGIDERGDGADRDAIARLADLFERHVRSQNDSTMALENPADGKSSPQKEPSKVRGEEEHQGAFAELDSPTLNPVPCNEMIHRTDHAQSQFVWCRFCRKDLGLPL